ncbi:MAG: ABC-three component system protein [Bacillota bacterium]|nr:ABC-three component system protein [Bacillota bacterium]
MRFCEFANILFKHSDTTYESHEFFLSLFDNIMRDPKSPEEIKLHQEDKYNPFAHLKPDSLDRLFKGTNPLNPKNVKKAISRKDTDKFAKYIHGYNGHNQIAIENEIKAMISDFNSDDNLGYACADLFLQILDDIYEGRESSGSSGSNNISTNSKLTAFPTQTIYYDESDGKLHIGNIKISIPKELEPPQDIAPEEEAYVCELLAAYAEALKFDALTKDDLDSLPKKFQRNFSDQRINYYSAARIDRFVRESFEKGEVQADKWKSETHDYIKETLWDDYDDGYKRILAVMKKVVDCSTTSVVSNIQNLVGPKEKKGTCHLLANDGIVRWVNEDE